MLLRSELGFNEVGKMREGHRFALAETGGDGKLTFLIAIRTPEGLSIRPATREEARRIYLA